MITLTSTFIHINLILLLAVAFIIFVQAMKPGLLTNLLLVLLISCVTQDICDEDNQSELVVKFKTGSLTNAADTIIADVTVYGIREGKTDSLLYDAASVSRILLPLDPGHGASHFVCRINDQSDTIGIGHDNEAYLISYTCGFAMMFHIREIHHTTHVISHAEVIESQVDAELLKDEEHIWIFF